jgi:carbon-monoxide dehydrogenase small subunit
MNDRVDIVVSVNSQLYERAVEPRLLLSDFLRHELGLTGTHVGCEHGVCGACTILLDTEPVRSCLMFAIQADGHEIVTVEGLGTPDNLHPIQEAFMETLVPFLEEYPDPTESEIREAISGNLCRCTGYQHIVQAVTLAAGKLRDL